MIRTDSKSAQKNNKIKLTNNSASFSYQIMNSVVIAKFGGSTIGVDGISIPVIIQRINSISKNAKVIAVFSAPLTVVEGKRTSLTDVVLELGNRAKEGRTSDLIILKNTYEKILELVSSEFQDGCKKIIDDCLDKVRIELEKAMEKKEFSDEIRSKTLAYSGEILMSYVMEYILQSQGISSKAVRLENWPIITDNNIEYTNFVLSESNKRIEHLEKLLEQNQVITIGGFIGRTTDGIITTYERGGSDRTAADLGILLHKKFDTKIDFEIALLQDAPTITSFLTPDDANHFNEVQIYLEALSVPFTLDTALVRGLDYYTRTTFEIISSKLGAQDALCGGGRYDKLAETLGGKQTPAVGFAAGLERILIAMDEIDTDQKIQADKIYLIGLGDAVRPTMLKILGEARKAGLIMEFDSLRRSIKSQMREANKIGASIAIIIGDKELKDKAVQIKDLKNGQQESIPFDSIISYIQGLN